MNFRTELGLPTVNSQNFISVLASLGLKRWNKLSEVSLEDYLSEQLTTEEVEDMDRFSPKTKVKTFLNPKGQKFVGFSQVGGDKDGVLVFSVLPGSLVPIIAEFKHGVEEIIIALPGGKIGQGETPEACGKREFLEEIGIELERVELLNPLGTPVVPRIFSSRGYYLVGFPKYPIVKKELRLDKNEFLQPALIRTDELKKLIWSYNSFFCPFSALLILVALEKISRGWP